MVYEAGTNQFITIIAHTVGYLGGVLLGPRFSGAHPVTIKRAASTHSKRGTKATHVLPLSPRRVEASIPDQVPPLSIGIVAIGTTGVCHVGEDSLSPSPIP